MSVSGLIDSAGAFIPPGAGPTRLFANHAMALQSRWTRGQANPWFPFQIAFQLLNLPAIVNPTHPDRGICDLLWFPTGGGKSAALYGLIAKARDLGLTLIAVEQRTMATEYDASAQ